ncbi:MAG: spore coat associated protein CotJA [Christensenellales bacterium]
MSDRNIKDGRRTEEEALARAHIPLGMAYVPFQRWEGILDAETALCKGTLFKALDLPYLTKGGCGRE